MICKRKKEKRFARKTNRLKGILQGYCNGFIVFTEVRKPSHPASPKVQNWGVVLVTLGVLCQVNFDRAYRDLLF